MESVWPQGLAGSNPVPTARFIFSSGVNDIIGYTPTPIMFYIYVLKSLRDGMNYIGSTNNLKKRLAEHNSGRAPSTKLRKPFILIYYEAYRDEVDARMREHNLKLRSRAYAQLKRRIERSINS